MTDLDRAVIEAAEKWYLSPYDEKEDVLLFALYNAVRARRAAQMVRCRATYRCNSTRCLHRVPHTHNEECETTCCADWPNCKREPCSPEPVEEPMVPEAEARRREREAFKAGWDDKYLHDIDRPEDEEEALRDAEATKRYPEPEDHDAHGNTFPHVDATLTTTEPPDPYPQHGPVNVDAGPSLESRVDDLDDKEKAHWARLNDFDRRVTDLERNLHTLENAHITLGGIVCDEIKKHEEDGK